MANHSADGFIEDMSINSIDEDGFQRAGVAKEIAHKISRTKNKRSFAIGILGEYGAGKTSFINLIKKQLPQEQVSFVDFNAWSADSTEQIQRDFFDLLSARLYEIDPRISSIILSYSRKLSRADSFLETLIKRFELISSLIRPGSFRDDYDRINEMIAATGKKIIITIDDIDRLYKDEVMEVLRLIRNTADFNNVFYLVAYERSFVDEAIKSVNANAAASFLDKIIQLEIPLPKREENDLLDLVEKHLRPFVNEEHLLSFKTNLIESGFRHKFEFSFANVFRQSRDVIKFINNFKITYGLIGGEVMFESAFVLELIKFRFPLVYERLYDQREQFIYESPTRSNHLQFFELITYKDESRDDRPVIEKILKEEGVYTDAEIDLITGLVRNLFFKFNRSKRAKNSIIYPMFFDRYFRFRLGNKELSETVFRTAWDGGLPAMKELIDQSADRKLLSDLSTRIFQEGARTRSEYELKVQSLFYLGPRFIRQKGTMSFDIEALTDLLWNYDHNIDKKYYNKDQNAYEAFLLQTFHEAEMPFLFHNEVIYNMRKGIKDISISAEKLSSLQHENLIAHVKMNGLSEDALWMFWWARYKEKVPVPGKPGMIYEYEHFDPEVIVSMREMIEEHDPFWFLKYSIEYDMRERDVYSVYKMVREMFGSMQELRTIVAAHALLDPEVKTDYLTFLDGCIAVDFQSWPVHKFITTLQPKRNDDDDY